MGRKQTLPHLSVPVSDAVYGSRSHFDLAVTHPQELLNNEISEPHNCPTDSPRPFRRTNCPAVHETPCSHLFSDEGTANLSICRRRAYNETCRCFFVLWVYFPLSKTRHMCALVKTTECANVGAADGARYLLYFLGFSGV